MLRWSASEAAQALDLLGASAGFEAGFARRREGWRHQRDQVVHELAVLDRNLVAARKRVDLARRSLVVHEESIAQIDGVYLGAQERTRVLRDGQLIADLRPRRRGASGRSTPAGRRRRRGLAR